MNHLKLGQIKSRRQKTEFLVSKLTDHPDLIAEQSIEILNRLDTKNLEKAK